ncbi:MAG TPA: SRPBCC domain-containing protein [Hyphomicrobiaceae bacterium]|jgi:uncharacterized protein YndB with AHSA1/START domain|nr:SRPBCC domain-containing protein [Hyphomicrobiaceae bacterium]
MLDKPSLTLKRRLKAPPSQVYSAWTDPKKIARWFGPRDTAQASVAAEIDLRVGGHYRISFTSEGGERHQVGGVYREVVPNRRLVFSWAWHSTPERASLVSITLVPDGETGTLLTLQHEQFFDEKARDGHERGWAGTLEKLDRYLS